MGCNLRDLATPHPVDLSDFNGQRVAVDAFLLAYQFITSLRKRGEGADGGPLTDSNGHPVSHLMGFLDRATIMIESGIDPVFVFDGRPHDLKMETLASRKSRKDEAKEKWDRAVADEDWTTAQKLGSQIVSYTREMVAETRAMLDLLGIANIEAPMEAEGAAAVRCARGDVDAVASQDWDTLLYGAPVMVRNLTSHGTKKFGRMVHAERIVLAELLDENGLSYEQLVDLGIMVGTDFHPGIKGVGPKTGLKLIREYGTIEEVCAAKDKEIPERLEEIREIFLNHPASDEPIANHGMCDETGLREMLVDGHDFSERRIGRALNRMEAAGRLRSGGQTSLFDF